MHLEGVVLWLALKRAGSSRSARRHPLSDPLEQPEWQGLFFVLPLLSWLSGSRKHSMEKAPE
jgi:hypothetical protein